MAIVVEHLKIWGETNNPLSKWSFTSVKVKRCSHLLKSLLSKTAQTELDSRRWGSYLRYCWINWRLRWRDTNSRQKIGSYRSLWEVIWMALPWVKGLSRNTTLYLWVLSPLLWVSFISGYPKSSVQMQTICSFACLCMSKWASKRHLKKHIQSQVCLWCVSSQTLVLKKPVHLEIWGHLVFDFLWFSLGWRFLSQLHDMCRPWIASWCHHELHLWGQLLSHPGGPRRKSSCFVILQFLLLFCGCLQCSAGQMPNDLIEQPNGKACSVAGVALLNQYDHLHTSWLICVPPRTVCLWKALHLFFSMPWRE